MKCNLPRSGDKKMLAQRVASLAIEQAKELTNGIRVIVLTAPGKENIGQQSGHALQEELRMGEERRG